MTRTHEFGYNVVLQIIVCALVLYVGVFLPGLRPNPWAWSIQGAKNATELWNHLDSSRSQTDLEGERLISKADMELPSRDELTIYGGLLKRCEGLI